MKSLAAQISFLDEEVAVLRRRLADSPRQVRLLEERLRETEGSLSGVSAQNERLAATLREARDGMLEYQKMVASLEAEIDRLQDLQPTESSYDRAGIFIVHGHDQRLKLEVARLLENVTNEEITILAERPNRGQTIIEKLEQYSKVRFAVILLTPDDQVVEKKSEGLVNRARQNVILELGLFLGLLGRDRVCVLYKSDLEMPSDYSGVLFIEADDRGGWKLELLRELQAAEISIDWQRIR